MIEVKKLYYFVELDNGTQRIISKKQYEKKHKEFEALCWDFDEYSQNIINLEKTEGFIQYENCKKFYNNDFYIILGYGQREIYK
jgi:hypothetical protein